MDAFDLAYLSKLLYEERLQAAQQRRGWRSSDWFRKLPKLAQYAAMLFW
jgi:hypothetical protein